MESVDVDDSVDTASMKAHSAVDRAADTIAPVLQRIQSSLSSAATSLATAADNLSAVQEARIEDARTRIRTSPLLSVSLAFAVGLLIGRVKGRE